MILGIDFTVSNLNAGKETFEGRSLHDLSEGKPENPYIRVMSAIGRTLGKFDVDGEVPVFGKLPLCGSCCLIWNFFSF